MNPIRRHISSAYNKLSVGNVESLDKTTILSVCDTSVLKLTNIDTASIIDQLTTSKFFSAPQPAQTLCSTKKKPHRCTSPCGIYEGVYTQALSQSAEINEHDTIGINVAAKLKKMENKQSIYADLLINKILSKGLLGSLTPKTDVYELEGTNIRNDELYFSNLQQNNTPETIVSHINYNLQRPTLPLSHHILSMQSNSSAPVYSQLSAYGVSGSSLNSSPQE